MAKSITMIILSQRKSKKEKKTRNAGLCLPSIAKWLNRYIGHTTMGRVQKVYLMDAVGSETTHPTSL